jgi:hypothetical protein
MIVAIGIANINRCAARRPPRPSPTRLLRARSAAHRRVRLVTKLGFDMLAG